MNELSTSGPPTHAERIAAAARELGFVRVGFAPVTELGAAAEQLRRWLASGYHGTLAYLENAAERAEPAALLPGAKTIVAVALPYGEAPAAASTVPLRSGAGGSALTGTIARYARGEDYHLVLKAKLATLAERVGEIVGRAVASRVCVDTAPLFEHEIARLAGIGFTAKSTLTIAPGVGSYVLLGELLLELELPPSAPIKPGCGACRACLDACPTGAFVDAYVLDARRCISYLTIEQAGVIPRELRALLGTRVFGCDVCQEVCPFNGSSTPKARAPELAPRPELALVDLVALLELGAAGYRKLVRRTALRRVTRDTLARNAAVALGNTGDARAVAPLSRALASHASPLVRLHAAWALGQLTRHAGAREALAGAADHDPAEAVQEEARAALAAAVSAKLPP